MISGSDSLPRFTNYLGFEYKPWEEEDVDNIKIWHDIISPRGNIIDGPWGPYEVPSEKQFCDFIDSVFRDVDELGNRF